MYSAASPHVYAGPTLLRSWTRHPPAGCLCIRTAKSLARCVYEGSQLCCKVPALTAIARHNTDSAYCVQAIKPAAKPKKQTVYFVKSNKQELTDENLNSEVCCSTFCEQPKFALPADHGDSHNGSGLSSCQRHSDSSALHRCYGETLEKPPWMRWPRCPCLSCCRCSATPLCVLHGQRMWLRT